MPSKDLHNSILQKIALNYGTINTNTTTAGVIIDTQGYEAVEFIIYSGTITDGTYVPKIEVGDNSALSDAAEVTTDFRLGTYANATFTGDNDNAAKRIGFTSDKRYARLSLVSTATSSGGALGAVVILGHPRHQGTAAS